MTDGRDALLTMMLDCGSDDLRLLDDVGYAWYDIFADAGEVAELGGINSIMTKADCVDITAVQQ